LWRHDHGSALCVQIGRGPVPGGAHSTMLAPDYCMGHRGDIRLRSSPVTRVIAFGLVAFLVTACARVERHPVPAALVSEARVPGMGATRFWGDEVPKDIITFVQAHMPSVQRMAAGATVR